ncbi:MAG: FAD-dependent oxidoreductase [Candidatus Competibacterales bacterium]
MAQREMRPAIVVVDDDPQVLPAIERDVRRQYRRDYRIFCAESGNEALEIVKTIKLKNEVVALLLSDQRMPEMSGVEFLQAARRVFPEAKRALLTAYSDTEAAIKAINEVQLDYYLMKPWDPPEERLYPVLDDLLESWRSQYRAPFTGIRIVGYQWSPGSHAVKNFLAGNLIPFRWLDVELSDEAEEILALTDSEAKDLPVVVFEDGTHLANPSLAVLAERVGLQTRARQNVYDVAIVGAGPAGLAAAVYGASEGLKTVVIERQAPGGQAGTSSRIENYLGFPAGLSGAELTRRAVAQATRLGAEFIASADVVGLEVNDHYKRLRFADGTCLDAQSLIVATGVQYRHLEAEGLDRFTGAGVYYGAATTEANACRGSDVYIVGGGNSAGQAAMYLSQFARQVYIAIRRDNLQSTMSQYLIDQIAATDNIELLIFTEVVEAKGEEYLQSLVLQDSRSKEQRTVDARAIFIFIGAKPHTEWLGEGIVRNKRGFVATGRDLFAVDGGWRQERDPLLLETSVPGVFAAGDVRAGAMNRIASAVGEGALAIKLVHEYLAGR